MEQTKRGLGFAFGSVSPPAHADSPAPSVSDFFCFLRFLRLGVVVSGRSSAAAPIMASLSSNFRNFPLLRFGRPLVSSQVVRRRCD